MPESISELDLSPLAGRVYTNFSRPWEQDIFYFLLIDRFHDNSSRSPKNKTLERSSGYSEQAQLHKCCGGTLNGIRKNLPYIKNLGSTALWISPFLHNNPESYHGYAIQNFLEVDPRFGSKQDIVDLVKEAHALGLKVVFDVVINHSGNNWNYNGGTKEYKNGRIYSFGGWRFENYPLPTQLKNFRYYRRQGKINGWDEYPETREGDFFDLKKFRLDDTLEGKRLQDILFFIYAWWIKETDCDGFRLDTMKHIHPLQVASFCTRIKEYTRALGKDDFFIFGEHPGSDVQADEYRKVLTSEWVLLNGPDAVLDFPLHYILPNVISGKASRRLLELLFNERLKKAGGGNQELKRVTFLDNHDQLGQLEKQRLAFDLSDLQVIGALGILLTLPGIPCIYYGTEQGFSGSGRNDAFIREAMFNPLNNSDNFLNENCCIYKEIYEIARLRKEHQEIILGSIKFFPVNAGGKASRQILAFTRTLGSEKVIILYNRSKNYMSDISVQLESETDELDKVRYLYGGEGSFSLIGEQNMEKVKYFKINLLPFQFAILKLDPKLGNR